jgi:hypothetical protein
MLRLYCGHVATRVACNIQHVEPLPPFSSTQHPTPHVCNIETQRLQHWKIMFATPNNTCLQLRDSASATSKMNVCNILSIWKQIVATSGVNIHNTETSSSTFATSTQNTCNILMRHLKHVRHTLASSTKTLPHVVSPRRRRPQLAVSSRQSPSPWPAGEQAAVRTPGAPSSRPRRDPQGSRGESRAHNSVSPPSCAHGRNDACACHRRCAEERECAGENWENWERGCAGEKKIEREDVLVKRKERIQMEWWKDVEEDGPRGRQD